MNREHEDQNPMKSNDEFTIKRYLFDYLSKESEASLELRNYANEMIKSEYKAPLTLYKFQKESDRLIIKRFKRKAFLEVTKQKNGK